MKKGRKGGRKKTAKVVKNRVERLVDLQEKAVKDWGQYSQNASRLITKGTMSPGSWMKEYTDISRSVVQNFGELMRIISGAK